MDYREQFFSEFRPIAGDLKGSSVLVIGCGQGLDCVPFVEAGVRIPSDADQRSEVMAIAIPN
jgi:hypothetical protein